jgi:hypothetical protein
MHADAVFSTEDDYEHAPGQALSFGTARPFTPCGITFYIKFGILRDDLGRSKTDKPPVAYEPMSMYNEFTAISAALFTRCRRYTANSATELNLADRSERSEEP